MKNKWLFIAGLSGFLCVAIGAFAAHGLSKVLEPKELAWIETGCLLYTSCKWQGI